MGVQEYTKQMIVQANLFRQINTVTSSFSTALAAGETKTIYVYAPAGFMSRIVAAKIFFPKVPAATAGNISFLITAASANIGILQASSADWTTDIEYDFGEVIASTSKPSLASQPKIFDELWLTENSYIRIQLTNNTNASDGGTSKIIVFRMLDERLAT